jgi:hypothetical protein
MEQTMPSSCKVNFEDPQKLHEFSLTVTPEEGYWLGGRFRFHVFVTEDYNMAVSFNNIFLSMFTYDHILLLLFLFFYSLLKLSAKPNCGIPI